MELSRQEYPAMLVSGHRICLRARNVARDAQRTDGYTGAVTAVQRGLEIQ